MSVGENIKNIRLKVGMRQKLYAEREMVDQSMMWQIERGSKVPTMLLGQEIAKALGCELTELLK